LQVHHIKERNQGGGNEEDNLIVTCMSCHTDVHSKVPFARRFSEEELKGHRDALVKLVADGKLPLADTDDADEVMLKLLGKLRTAPPGVTNFTLEAKEILLRSANTNGRVSLLPHNRGLDIDMGAVRRETGNDRRMQAKYKHGIKQLVECGMLEYVSPTHLDVTYDGYLAADEILTSEGQGPNT